MRGLLSAIGLAGLLGAVSTFGGEALTVDFRKDEGPVRPELHSSGWGPRSCPRSIVNDDADVKAMNLRFARTHDWALVNKGQRVVDWQYVFPLPQLDAKDPANYVFAPTDYLLKLSRDVGLEIFYRLGTSIEHTGDTHFNALVPQDFDKTAEVFAGIVRHYNAGWANGFRWNIRYWEIWNEPDYLRAMWYEPGTNALNYATQREKFMCFFTTCAKRIKGEFPDVKVGGPAITRFQDWWFRQLFERCRKDGVAPDFISWHYYGTDPDAMVRDAEKARGLCDEFGFTTCEVIVNEWHYLKSWDGLHRNVTPEMVARTFDGPSGHHNVDSAAFTLTVLSKFQLSKCDQAYFYGCAHDGNWGYMDQYGRKNKVWRAMCLFGSLMHDGWRISTLATEDTVTAFAVRSPDGKVRKLLVTDYRGTEQVLKMRVLGADGAKRVTAVVLDHTRDSFPCAVDWHGDVLTLVKPDKNSSAWLVDFE